MASALVTGPLLFAAADPTTSYAPTNFIRCADFLRIGVDLSFVKTDGTSFEWYYEWSPDGTNWHRESNKATSAGVNTVTANNQTFVAATAKLHDSLWIEDAFFRVQIQRTGGAVTNTAAVSAFLSRTP